MRPSTHPSGCARSPIRLQRGISLVEILVGMVIGLMVAMPLTSDECWSR